MAHLRRRAGCLVLLCLATLAGCADANPTGETIVTETTPPAPPELATATFGGGCFWCVEAVFESLEGVTSATSGYAGGRSKDPTYKEVCSGTSGHAEVVQIRYDPSRVTYLELLEVFFKTHDPTTLNRQGADVGTQYRSVIFTHGDAQAREARDVKAKLDASGAFAAPIVTEIAPFDAFHRAEDYHQGYYVAQPDQPYCQAVIAPKLDKLRKVFADKLKEAE